MEKNLFDQIADAIETSTSFDRLEARGTLRIALEEAGLDAASVTANQMAVVMRKIMPKELESRGIDDSAQICENLAKTAESSDVGDESRSDSPEAVFQRLGG
jgi:hypothetical protein